MAETHELRLKIDAGAAKRGAREFTGALETVKRAVRDLDRDTDGLFTKLKKTSTAPTGRNSQAAALTSIRTAARQAESQVATLQRQLNRTGNAAGITRTDKALASFRREMSAGVNTTEELRLAKDRLAQTLHEVRESARAANEVQRLRTAYQRTAAALDPLTTGTHAYRRAVLSAEQAARAGAISEAQKIRTIAKAREAYLSAGAAAENYAAQQARLYGTRAGWGLGPGMGRQLGLQVNQMAQVAGMSTSVEQALKGISYQAADVGLAFGAAGIAIGSVAGVLLPVLIDRIFDVIPPTLSFKEAMDNLNASIEAARTAAGRTGDYTALRDEYGAVTTEVLRLIEVQKQLAQIDALSDLRAARDALSGETAEIGWLKSLAGYADTAAGRTRRLRDELDLTKEAATTLESLWSRSRATNNAEELADIYAEMRQTIVDSAGGVENLTTAQGEHVRKLTEAEDAARRTTGAIAGATDQTYMFADAMSAVNVQMQAIAASLAAIGGGAITNASAQAELTALERGASLKEAATARIRYQKEAEFAAKEMAASAQGGIGGWAQKQLIDAERHQFESGLEISQRLDAAREAARKAVKSSSGKGGGGRKAALTEEQKATERLTKSLKDRLTSLREERIELDLVASGQFETQEGARAMAEAQMTMGGAVDATTEALIRQIDAAQKSANEMRKAANAGAQGWLNAVPSYQEAADQIEVEVLDSLSNEIASFAKTGEFNIERLADSILATMADLAAKLAVKELFGDLLGGGASGGGGLLSGLFGGDGGFLAGLFSEGGYSTQAVAHSAVPASAFRHAPHFSEGTANTSGIPAMLHPNEAVIPLSKGRKIPVEMNGAAGGNGAPIYSFNSVYHIQTPDADSFRKSQKQVTADAFSAGRRAASQNA